MNQPAAPASVLRRRAEHYQKKVITVEASCPVREVALRMHESGVGALVVLREAVPVGMITDRDLLEHVIVRERDPLSVRAEDIMSTPLAHVSAGAPLEHVLAVMADRGLRRVAVMQDGHLSGIVSLDDIFVTISDELAGLAHGVRVAFDTEQLSSRAIRAQHLVEDGFHDLLDQIERVGGSARESLRQRVDTIRKHLHLGGRRD